MPSDFKLGSREYDEWPNTVICFWPNTLPKVQCGMAMRMMQNPFVRTEVWCFSKDELCKRSKSFGRVFDYLKTLHTVQLCAQTLHEPTTFTYLFIIKTNNLWAKVVGSCSVSKLDWFFLMKKFVMDIFDIEKISSACVWPSILTSALSCVSDTLGTSAFCFWYYLWDQVP
jgi:hypothetical protein